MKTIMNMTPRVLLSAAVAVATLSACATTEKKPEEPVAAPVAAKPVEKADAGAAVLADAGKLLKEGKPAEAKAKYQQLIAKEPKNMDAKLGLAQAHIKLGEYEEAKTVLAEVKAAEPDNADVPLLLGVLYKQQGDYQAGIDLYEAEIDKRKEKGQAADTALLNNLIVLYRAAKEYDKAEKTCTSLLSRSPDNVDALKNLSLVYFDQGKYALAETIAVNSLKLNDKDAALYNNRGMIRVKRGRYPEAMTFFYKAVQIDASNIEAHLNIGSIALRYRDYATASKHYGNAMKLEPRHPEANLGYGLALAGLSGGLPPDQQPPKAAEAITQLNRALEINPKAAAAVGEIAMVNKMQLNKLDEAKTYCDKYMTMAEGADNDTTKTDCQALEGEIKAAAAAARMREQMKQQEAEEKKNAPPPAPAPPAAPADGAAPTPAPAPAPAGG
jgi:tetratricopeptide (TPR) repeat protein